MADEIKTNETAEVETKVNKTELLKQHMQAIIKQTLGVKVSKEKAWELFKNTIHGTVELTMNVEGKSIPLSGVGTFEVLETKPRGSKAGLDKEGKPIEGATPWDCVPRFRFYASSTIDKMLEQQYGFADHGITVEHYGIFAPQTEEPEKADKPSKEEKKPAKKAEEVTEPAETQTEGATPDVEIDEI